MVRLSTIINTPSYFDSLEIALFHGTTTYHLESFRKHGIRLVDTKKPKDFGPGFYLTTNYWQALDYATKYGVSTYEPIVICCFIKLGDLRSSKKFLIIDDYDELWLETIVRGRCNNKNPLSNEYEWIYGRCGDRNTSVFNQKLEQCGNDYKKLLELISPRDLTPNINLPHYEYDQLWIGSKNVLNKLKNPHIIYHKGVEAIEIKLPIQQQ